MQFQLTANYQPTGDQPQAIEQLVQRLRANERDSTLLGVTGSGKTFTMANVIQQLQRPTLVIAHNKTLAAQLYQEFRDFFPQNAVSYFVSYYDYYQPEAYIPSTDTYIEKESTINDEIDKLRLAATTNLLTRPDVIVVASVSCIYNLGSPVEYGKYILRLVEGEILPRQSLLLQLQNLQYQRSDAELFRGSFRIRGDTLQLWPAYENRALRIELLDNQITHITWIDPVSGSPLPNQTPTQENGRFIIYPAKHYMMDPKSQTEAFTAIEADLADQLARFKSQGKIVEAYRLKQKVSYDLEMMREFGFVNGIENYSRYFDGRQPGQPPFTLLDYFAENAKTVSHQPFLTVVDESHITLPQVKGMHHGDRARKETLIEFGFRLPSALDNRPLNFDEFLSHTQSRVFVSATPSPLEISMSGGSESVVEQLIRPTGLVDPIIELRPTTGQIEDLVIEIIRRQQLGQRTLVTTLTKKMAEALTEYLNDHEQVTRLVTQFQTEQAQRMATDPDRPLADPDRLPIEQMEMGKIDPVFQTQAQLAGVKLDPTDLIFPKVAYLHSEVETLERSDILDDLRRGTYDVVVGINLLREGLDLPEVTLVAILDADKEGFLRSRTSLIQTMGRAARHQDGRAILYADNLTGSMKDAIGETQRRRSAQISYNLNQGISPQSIAKPIRDRMIAKSDAEPNLSRRSRKRNTDTQVEQGMTIVLSKTEKIDLSTIQPDSMIPADRRKLAAKLKRRLNQAIKDMDFELAAILRDTIQTLN